jgi:hypothetical protein
VHVQYLLACHYLKSHGFIFVEWKFEHEKEALNEKKKKLRF